MIIVACWVASFLFEQLLDTEQSHVGTPYRQTGRTTSAKGAKLPLDVMKTFPAKIRMLQKKNS